MIRRMIAYALAVLATLAEMTVAATKMVFRAGRWVLESVTPTRRAAPPAGGGSADMAAALAEAAT
ncbi:hypothetical protein FV219_05910, partial [Methylobacterium sp. WL122]